MGGRFTPESVAGSERNFYQQVRKDFMRDMLRFLALLIRNKTGNEILKSNDSDISIILNKIDELDPKNKQLGVEEKHYRKYYDEMITKISDERGQYKPSPQRIYDYLVRQKYYFEDYKKAKLFIIKKLKKCLSLVSITIILSIGFLPLYDLLKCSIILCVILTFIVLMTLVSISYTSWCVYKISIE